MARTESTMIPLGASLPSFQLPDGSGRMYHSDDCAGAKGTLVVFMCNHCPFVVHVADGLAALGRDYADSGVGIMAINSNDVESHPDDAPDKMVAFVKEHGVTFPYLFDETQDVARAFSAACTPDFFLYDADQTLVYRGQMDDSRPDSGIPVTGVDLRAAMDAVANGTPVAAEQKPSLGCNIKWSSGAKSCGDPA